MPVNSAISENSRNWYLAFSAFTLIFILMGIIFRQPLLFGFPAVFLLAFTTIVDFKFVFYLLLACIPISIEIYFDNGLATDLPTEPLIVGLMMVFLVWAAGNRAKLDGNFIRHPLIILLFLHLGWILIATINSQFFLVSLKFFTAKIWYVVVFVFMAGYILKDVQAVKKFFWWVFIPLFLVLLTCLFRQYLEGFAFHKIHETIKPPFRNHVSYASILSLFVPFIWMMRNFYPEGSMIRKFLLIAFTLFLIGIYFSYTRAAYVAVGLSFAGYLVIRFRMIQYALGLAVIAALAGIVYLTNQNTYIDYAPDFEKTITHLEFDKLLEATYNFEDISTMERGYRWVAAAKMANEKPLLGFGPGNFFNSYRGYTVELFRTYVSDNPERSGIHSYYFMTLVDQGIPGLLIYLLLVFGVLIYGQKLYHRTSSPERKRIIMMVLMSTIVIDSFQIINDLLETDKTGPFFFMNMAILVNMDLLDRKEKRSS